MWGSHTFLYEKNLQEIEKEKDPNKKLILLLQQKADFQKTNTGAVADEVIKQYNIEIDIIKTQILINRLPDSQINYSELIIELRPYIETITESELEFILDHKWLLKNEIKPTWIGSKVDAWLFARYFDLPFNDCFSTKSGNKIDNHNEPAILGGKYKLSDKSKKLFKILCNHFPEKMSVDSFLNGKKRVSKKVTHRY